MDVMLVVDMQVGLLNGGPKHDLGAVIERINRLAANIRERSGTVIFVQHCGGKGDDFEPETLVGRCLPNSIATLPILSFRKSSTTPLPGPASRPA